MTDYQTFVGDTANHHLVLKLESDGDKIETKMTGGDTKMHDYVVVDDGWCVYSITNKGEQKIHVKVTKSNNSIEKVYDLSNLTLSPI